MRVKSENYMQDLYMNAYLKVLNEFEPGISNTTETIKKLIFYGVNAINLKPQSNYLIREKIEEDFIFTNGIIKLMGTLTPIEFMQVFPIEKEYKGHKWGFKDYFYTKDYINTLNPDEPIGIGDEILNFLWEYHNWKITEFIVASMECISDWNRLNGEPTLVDEIADELGLDFFTVHTDNLGNDFIIQDGKTVKLGKLRPKHLKLVK